MKLAEKMKEMIDRRAEDISNFREDIVKWVKCALDEKTIESIVMNQIEHERFEFVIDFSVAETGEIGFAGLWRDTKRKLTGEQKRELAHIISEEIAKIVKDHGFYIIGAPIFEHRGTQHGRVYFKCKEE